MKNETEQKEQKHIGTFMIAMMWILLLIMLVYLFEDVIEQKVNPNQTVNTLYVGQNIREVTLQRNYHGHYVTNGQINGQQVVFMLDTGATGVAIPEHLSRNLNLKKGAGIEMYTANGRATGYMTTIDLIGVGEIELENVRAVINPNDKSEMILLGMSFLKEIEFTQRGDELILRQVSNKYRNN
jgi:aspartyl protease family protein